MIEATLVCRHSHISHPSLTSKHTHTHTNSKSSSSSCLCVYMIELNPHLSLMCIACVYIIIDLLSSLIQSYSLPLYIHVSVSLTTHYHCWPQPSLTPQRPHKHLHARLFQVTRNPECIWYSLHAHTQTHQSINQSINSYLSLLCVSMCVCISHLASESRHSEARHHQMRFLMHCCWPHAEHRLHCRIQPHDLPIPVLISAQLIQTRALYRHTHTSLRVSECIACQG